MDTSARIGMGMRWARWRWHAVGRHGLHAPLLYAWVEAIREGRGVRGGEDIEEERRRIEGERTVLEGADPGCGSRRGGGERTVGEVARVALKPEAQVRALVELGRAVGAREVLEFGTCLGITAAHLAAAGFRVRTVEGHPGLARRAVEGWRRVGLDGQVQLEVGLFSEVLDRWEAESPVHQWDMIFLDGHHDGEAMRGYLQRLRPLLAPGGCIVCDDIHWSSGMERAWHEEIRGWRTTVDAFHFGVLFGRNDLTPGHFRVRLPGATFGV